MGHDSYSRTKIFRELVSLYLTSQHPEGHYRPAVPGTLSESFSKPESFGDVLHDLPHPFVIRVRCEDKWELAESVREAKATAKAAAIGGEHVPAVTINRRRSNSGEGVKDAYVLMDLETLAHLLAEWGPR